MKKWSFSLILLVVYVLTFHLWMHLDRKAIMISGIVISWILTGMLMVYNRRLYFVNRLDCCFHFAVILDLILEAVLPLNHDHFGFYFCALGFALVIGGYRQAHLKTKP